MGYFTQLKTADIKPGELSIPTKERRFIYLWGLIDCYLSGEEDTIVPAAVKKLDSDKWIIVDSHHRLLVADLFKGESRVYVPTHKQDFFTGKLIPSCPEFMIKDLNGTIERMYDLAEKVIHLEEGINLSDIRRADEFWFLRDIESAKRFHKEWRIKINI